MNNISIERTFQLYSGFWIFLFVGALITVAGANLGFGVPLSEVANVQLGSMFGVVIFFEGLNVILAVIILVLGQWKLFLIFLLYMVAYAFVAFAPVIAMQLCAWIGGVTLDGHSYVYDRFIAFTQGLLSPLHWLLKMFASSSQAWVYTERFGTVLSILLTIPTAVSHIRAVLNRRVLPQ